MPALLIDVQVNQCRCTLEVMYRRPQAICIVPPGMLVGFDVTRSHQTFARQEASIMMSHRTRNFDEGTVLVMRPRSCLSVLLQNVCV